MKKLFILLTICAALIGIKFQTHYDISGDLDSYVKKYEKYMKEVETAVAREKKEGMSGWARFTSEIVRLSKMYNFAPNVAVAQGALESARGTSYFARTRNNFLGIGAFDSNPEAALRFASPEDCANYWVTLMSKNYKLAWKNKNNPMEMVKAIKEGGYATSESYVKKVTSMPEFTNILQ